MRIKQLRLQKKLTQQQVADFCGLTQGAIGGYERGRCTPNPETLLKMAQCFGCTVDEILAEPEEVITLGTLAELETSLQAKLDSGEITVEEAEQEWQDYRNRYEYMRGW